MKKVILSGIPLLFMALDSFSQNPTAVYGSFLKFPNSFFDVQLGFDYAHQITRKKSSSGRIYVAASPYFLWKGYQFDQGQLDNKAISSKYDNYQVVLPILLRFEFAPNRIILGRRPGKHDKDIAVFWEIGLAAHYLLNAHLKENFYDGQNNLQFSYDGSLIPSSTISYTYMAFGFGARFNRINMFFRYFQNIHEPTFQDVSTQWPSQANSFFFQDYSKGSFYKQDRDYITVCFGYSL